MYKFSRVILSYEFRRVCRVSLPVPVAARSKALVCGHSPAEIVGSNPTGETWIFVCCECCVLSGKGLCDELITRPEESYQLWCVVVCDLETSRMRRPWPALGRSATAKKKKLHGLLVIAMKPITNYTFRAAQLTTAKYLPSHFHKTCHHMSPHGIRGVMVFLFTKFTQLLRLFHLLCHIKYYNFWSVPNRVRFPMVSLEFFIDIVLPAALWSRSRLSL